MSDSLRGGTTIGGYLALHNGMKDATLNGNKIWHSGNDGSGSGLDADKLDGKEASAFALAHSHPYLGSSAKAVDSDKLDGINSSSFLRSDTDDTFSGALISTARNKGLFGTYDSHKTDQIWSMGTAYKNHSSGTNFGNLFGLAYKHTNNPTGGTMAGGHQMVWCVNGSPKAAMGESGIWTSGSITATGDVHAARVFNAVFNDLAEFMIKATDDLEPGDVLIKDEKKNGLITTNKEIDPKVVGVYSDTYGYALGAENREDKVPIAISGRVWVKVVGKIKNGDLLGSSNVKGCAKALTEDEKRFGVIIGKALESYDGSITGKRIEMLVMNT